MRLADDPTAAWVDTCLLGFRSVARWARTHGSPPRIPSEEMKGRISNFIALDASGYDLVTHEIGSNRYRDTFNGPGGQ